MILGENGRVVVSAQGIGCSIVFFKAKRLNKVSSKIEPSVAVNRTRKETVKERKKWSVKSVKWSSNS